MLDVNNKSRRKRVRFSIKAALDLNILGALPIIPLFPQMVNYLLGSFFVYFTAYPSLFSTQMKMILFFYIFLHPV